MKYCLTTGRWFFAISMAGFGLQQVVRQDFVRLVPQLPSLAPASPIFAVLSGTLLLISAFAILLERKRIPAAIFLGTFFLLTLTLYIPGVIANPRAGYVWTNPCKTLALIGGALLILALPNRFEVTPPPSPALAVPRVAQVSAAFFGLFFAVGGIQHFVYLDFVMQLVPSWIPAPRFWACFTGVALIAGGIGMNLRPFVTSAATLSGIMVFLWVLLLHLPRALAAPHEFGETSAIFEALALSGTAFLIAGQAVKGSRWEI